MIDIRGEAPEGSSPLIVARIATEAGAPVTQSQIQTWNFEVFDLSGATPGTASYSSLNNVTTLLTALTVGNGWDLDAIGGNFFQRVLRTTHYASLGGHTYLFRWQLDTTVAAALGRITVNAYVHIVAN